MWSIGLIAILTNDGALVRASPVTLAYFFFLFLLSFSFSPSNFFPTKFESYYCIPFGLGNTGEYSVLRLCIVPPCGRANTATLELNIPLYCPPSHAIIYIYTWGMASTLHVCVFPVYTSLLPSLYIAEILRVHTFFEDCSSLCFFPLGLT